MPIIKAGLMAVLVMILWGQSAPARAGTMTGPVSSILSMPGGIMMITLVGNHVSSPSCATSGGRFAFDATTPAGKLFAANLQIAFAMQKTVTLIGTGNCSVWPDTESITYFIATN